MRDSIRWFKCKLKPPKNPKGDSYKEMDKWWLLDLDDIVKEMNDPVVVKVTSKCCNFLFSDSMLST